MKKEPKPKTVGQEMISLRFQGEIKKGVKKGKQKGKK